MHDLLFKVLRNIFFEIYLYILFSSNFKLKIRERLFPESAKYVDNIYSS